MHTFYIDVPDDYFLDWSLSSNCAEVIRMQSNANRVTFIANSYALISKGDCYKVTVATPQDELFYLLTTGFDKADDHKVNTYMKSKGIWEKQDYED